MPRQPRIQLEDYPFHCIARGNNRQDVFYREADYHFYLQCLKNYSRKYGALVHAYVLMTNHVHLLMTPVRPMALSLTFQSIGRLYVRYINKTYGRSGTLWEGRFKASLVDVDEYLLACYRYIELNPVKAGMVAQPEHYRWSSARHNLGLLEDRVITPHDRYLALSDRPDERNLRYQELLRSGVSRSEQERIRSSGQSGLVLGSEHFQRQIEAMLKRRVRLQKRGRKVGAG